MYLYKCLPIKEEENSAIFTSTFSTSDFLKEFENYSHIGYALNIFSGSRITELFKQSLSRVLFTYFTQGYISGKKLLEDLKSIHPRVFFYYGKPLPIEDDKAFFLQRFKESFALHHKGENYNI